jgi:hypothetical protein
MKSDDCSTGLHDYCSPCDCECHKHGEIMRIIFLCKTCEYKNRMDLGRKNFTPWPTQFDSLTDAYMHLHATRKDRDDTTHEVIVEIVND